MTDFNRRQTVAGAALLSALIASRNASADESETAEAPGAAAFDLNSLAAENAQTDGPWLQFFDNNTMFAGIYEIAAGDEDLQQPHRADELYFVTKGKATLMAGEEEFDANAGGIFFVKADIPHRFVNIEEDLQVLVFFSKADPKV